MTNWLCSSSEPSYVMDVLLADVAGAHEIERCRAALCLLKLEDTLPIVFHADQCPVALLRCI